MIGGLVAVVAIGAFLSGWMARNATRLGRDERAYWAQADSRPALFDWAKDDNAQ